MKDENIKKKIDIVVATSLAPNNIENQRKAVDSWINLGFSVVSLNCKEEKEKLIKYFSDIEFIEVKRDGRNEYGKPYVYFDDFMEYFKRSSTKICGIINSDIHLLEIGKDFTEFIFKETNNSLVFGSRIDIESLDNINGIMFNGYDYFFFDKKLAFLYPKEDFCIGQPVWDIWIVFIPLLKNIKVKKIIDPIAYHIKHQLNWNNETCIRFFHKILNKYLGYELECSSALFNDINFKKFRRNIDSSPEGIVYKGCNNKPSILIVYDNCNISKEKSSTYESIINQTYKNIKVINAKKEEIDVNYVEEELIYFISEGSVLDKNFLKLLVNIIKDNDCAISGITLQDDDNFIFQDIYPIDEHFMTFKMNDLTQECIVFRTEFLRNQKFQTDNLSKYRISFMGRALVKINHYDYVKARISKFKPQKLCIYGAGEHTKRLMKYIDFSELNVMGIVDKNKNLEGSYINQYQVYNIIKLKELEFDYIFISSKAFEKEIYDELSKKINKEKIIRIYSN